MQIINKFFKYLKYLIFIIFEKLNINIYTKKQKRILRNKIIKSDTTFDDFTISPIIRQSLQHWAYQLTKEDFEKYKKNKL